jgi:hypothetical protein
MARTAFHNHNRSIKHNFTRRRCRRASTLAHAAVAEAHPAFAELGGDAVMGDGFADHFFTPASQFTVTLSGVGSEEDSGSAAIRKRWPSALTA